jgi:hypothetical protein
MLLVFELIVAVAVGQMAWVHSGALNRAYFKFDQRPTAETRMAFKRQRRITEAGRLVFSGVVFAVLAGCTLGLARRTNGEPAAGGNAE